MDGFIKYLLVSVLGLLALPASASDADEGTIPQLQDRGPGVPTSLFGTYIESGQWILYPFYEYYRNKDEEYEPRELGYPSPGFAGKEEYFGKFTQHEGVLFWATASAIHWRLNLKPSSIRLQLWKNRRGIRLLSPLK